MGQYIVPDILSEKSEELQEISGEILEIIRLAEDASDSMRRMTELEICSRLLKAELEKMCEDVQNISRFSEALYEIAEISVRIERELVDEAADGNVRRLSYKKTSELNRFDPGRIDIF